MHRSTANLRRVVVTVVLLTCAACGPGTVVDEGTLIEVVDDAAYLCLTDAINDSDPPSCGGAARGSRDNPRLVGEKVDELITALGGRSGGAIVTARQEGDEWVVEEFEVPPARD